MPKIDLASVAAKTGTGYPGDFATKCLARSYQRVGDAGGLSHIGVNVTRVPPGSWSSQMHAHTHEDEFVLILEGEGQVVTDNGDYLLGPGEMAAFPAGGEAHHIRNEGSMELVFLVVSNRDARDSADYPGIDLKFLPDGTFTHTSGEPY